ncbi:MAG: ATP-binding cassette domain-containing protein, partial [Planctomycetota bacterium]
MSRPPLLKLEQVSLHRGQTQILKQIDLSIDSGEHSAIVGPNGCGKSTLLGLLTRKLYPSIEPDGSQGRILINGRDDWHIDDLKSWMGFVSSALDFEMSTGQSGNLTVLQAIASGFNGSRVAAWLPTIESSMQHRCNALMEQMGLRGLS